MTGIPVTSELKYEASKTDFNMNPPPQKKKKKIKRMATFPYGLWA